MGGLLQGKVAIVTGAGRGIGRAEALALAAQGARVVVNDLGGAPDGTGASHSAADETVADIKKMDGQAVPSYDSVADFQAAGRLIQTAVDNFGRLDILVNNAGIIRNKLLWEMTEADWDVVVAVHLKGTFNTCRHAVPVMMAQRSGRIINTASNQWRRPEGGSNYAAAKAGVLSFTWGIAWELRNHGITCNAIAPFGYTRMLDYSAAQRQQLVELGLMSRERMEEVQGRPGPEFVPPLVVYLASDQAAGITGLYFRCGGGKIAVYRHPDELRGVYKNVSRDGPWTPEELIDLVPRELLAGVKPWWQ